MASQIVDLGNRAIFAPSVVSVSPSSGTVVGTLVDLKDADSFCNLFVLATPSVGTISGVIQVQVQCADGVSGALFSGGGFPISGSFTDPTSGLASVSLNPITGTSVTFPTYFQSGGIANFNSGLLPVVGGGFQVIPPSGFPNSGGPNTPYQGGFPAGTMPLGLTPTFGAQGGALLILSGGANLGFAYSGSFPRFFLGGMGFAGFQRTGQFARAIVLTNGTNANVTAGFLSMSMGGGTGYSLSPTSGLSGWISPTYGMPLV